MRGALERNSGGRGEAGVAAGVFVALTRRSSNISTSPTGRDHDLTPRRRRLRRRDRRTQRLDRRSITRGTRRRSLPAAGTTGRVTTAAVSGGRRVTALGRGLLGRGGEPKGEGEGDPRGELHICRF